MLVVLFQAWYLSSLYIIINCVMLLRNSLLRVVTIPKVQRHETKFVFWALILSNIIQEYLHLKLPTKARNVANLFSLKLSHPLIRPLTKITTASTPIIVAHYKLSYHDNFGRCNFFFTHVIFESTCILHKYETLWVLNLISIY